MIYLDNAATTAVYPQVLSYMIPYYEAQYGNPSSVYLLGRLVRECIEEVRSLVASTINADTDEIYFTSGTTEVNNWIRRIYNGTTLYTSAIEHKSMLSQFSHRLIPVDSYGIVDLDWLRQELKLWSHSYDAPIVSVMYANNEIGVIEPVKDVGELVYDSNGIFYSDATQAYMKTRIDVKRDCIDILAVSGHKLHAPKGIGFVYINKEISDLEIISPIQTGGGQERGFRAGTENVAGIVGMGQAIEILNKKVEEDAIKVAKLRGNLYQQLMTQIENCDSNTPLFRDTVPGILNMRFNGIDGQELVAMLDERDIYISSGSACNSGNDTPSHVLKAIGLDDNEIRNSVRFSLSDLTTQDEIDKTVIAVKECVDILRMY